MTANIQHSSVNNEQYTPSYIVEPAREIYGGFDIDPASTPEANLLVKASRIFTKEDNGYSRLWGESGGGAVAFVNPPGGVCDENGLTVIKAVKGRLGCKETGECGLPPGHKHRGVTSSQAAWWAKACMELKLGRLAGFFFVGFSLELLQHAQAWDCPHPLDFPCVIPKERIPFDTWVDGERVSGDDPTHSNVLVFAGADAGRVRELFGEIGYVHVPGGPS